MQFLKTSELFALLQAAYPDKPWNRTPFIENGFEHEAIQFTHDEVGIHDPFTDDCGNPKPDRYGLTEEHARLLRRHNRPYEKHLFGGDYDLHFVFDKVKNAIETQPEANAENFLDDFGFTPYHTGGGCMAYAIHNEDGSHILVTDQDTGLPQTMGEAWVGLYDCQGDEIKGYFPE